MTPNKKKGHTKKKTGCKKKRNNSPSIHPGKRGKYQSGCSISINSLILACDTSTSWEEWAKSRHDDMEKNDLSVKGLSKGEIYYRARLKNFLTIIFLFFTQLKHLSQPFAHALKQK